jgi:hypothetical protein
MTPERTTTRRSKRQGVALEEALRRIDEAAPGAALIHLGQTPFWDEPAKALIAARSDRPIIAGIHDLDYFSRQRAPLPGPRWQVLPRNDGSTRDLWIAAGELSSLFGAEVWPNRQALVDAGVRLDRIARGRASDLSLDAETEAYGWRGLALNQVEPKVICEIPARDAVPALASLLGWAGRESSVLLAYAEDRRELRGFMRRMARTIQDFVSQREDASLAHLLLFLLERMYTEMIGQVPDHVRFETTRRLMTFNRETAGLRRFRFAEHFLRERHAPAAVEAYRRAVEHSGVADPSLVGEGALPFDVYIPGRGRGGLQVTAHEVRIALPQPVRIPTDRPARDLHRLAEAIEGRFGSDVALFGKALTLPAMLCGEFVMTLTERGSSYMPRTRRMIADMRAAGVPVEVNPLLRMRLRTWSSLSAVRRSFILPPHLSQAFRTSRVTSGRFARDWKGVVREQRDFLARMRDITRPCELVRHLSRDQHDVWFDRLEKCNQAQRDLLEVQRKTDRYRGEAMDVRSKEDEAAEEVRMLEKRRGEINRSRLRPLKRKLADLKDEDEDHRKELRAEYQKVEREGKALLLALESKLKERRRLREKRRQWVVRIHKIEKGARATAARKLLRDVERSAEKARIELARNAILVSEGLPYSNVRPAAWWMPALDPSGKWFKRMARTARFRVEPLHEVEE